MIYHPFQPTVQGEKRWGYYFRQSDGKKTTVIKHPDTGKRFKTRVSVEQWIDELRGREVHGSVVTIKELSKYLFNADGPWAQRQARRRDGKPLSIQTMREHELNVRLHIEPAIGKERVVDVDTQMIEEMLYSLDLSNRSRRNVASTTLIILKEAVRRRIIKVIPPFELPTKKSRKPSVLVMKELRALFPRDPGELVRVWAPGKTTAHPEPKEARLALAACACTMFLGGLRPQEARAVGPGQLMREDGVLLITRSMNAEGKVQEYVKMGDERDPRYRGTFLVDWAMEILEAWLKVRPRRIDFLFTYMDKPIRPELLHARISSAVKAAGITTEGRRIIPYSGRYTFESTVRPFIPMEILMALMGHVDRSMPDHYDMPVLKERMRQLAPYRKKIGKAIG